MTQTFTNESPRSLDELKAIAPFMCRSMPEGSQRDNIENFIDEIFASAMKIILELDPRELPEWVPGDYGNLEGRAIADLSVRDLHYALRSSIGMLTLYSFLEKPILNVAVEQLAGIIIALYGVPEKALISYVEAKINAARNRS